MNRDFTLDAYKLLCESLLQNDYRIKCVHDFLINNNSNNKIAIIRHDVDKRPENALILAKIESEYDIYSTYYFRTNTNCFKKDIIKSIQEYGHEIGYHYEVLALCRGDEKKAIRLFEKELNRLRNIVPIKTIVMHGTPWSKRMESELWDNYNFQDYNILGDSYLSLDYGEVLYFSDTGRRWNGEKYSVWDMKNMNPLCSKIKSTDELINLLPTINKHILINSHPQRWSNRNSSWLYELFSQSIKNIGKRLLNMRKLTKC